MQVGETIYLDYQASTPVDERVLKVMQEASTTLFANPHAADHALGWRAAAAIGKAAGQVGNLFELQGDDVVFTSGASEANAMAIRTAEAIAARSQRTELLIGAADHGSILNESAQSNLTVRYITLDERGAPDPEQLETMISDTTALVSIVGVNNENGAIADLASLSRICKTRDVLFHADLAQAPLAMDLDVLDLNIAFATVSAHKLYGPKGVGALLAGPGVSEIVRPVVAGAGQQGGRRGGTMPTELIVGFGEACRIVAENGQNERDSVAVIRDHFVRILEGKQIAALVGSIRNRHPGNALMRFPGTDASDLLARLQPQVAASTQSACSSGSIEPSHVLQAMGYDRHFASECARFCFGRFSTTEQADSVVDLLASILDNT
ncbi:MAG: aminotransferase class V-fold PLP-dependent enzyme [Planctomycetaceae bacterium]|nr:aminotransferase class V-fold PLP-dependent enzyme [Planctomycetaceae bacterium]